MPYMQTGNSTAEDRARLLARYQTPRALQPLAVQQAAASNAQAQMPQQAPAPAPAPTSYPAPPGPGRAAMAQPSYGTNSSISSLTNPQPNAVGPRGLFPGLTPKPYVDPFGDLDPGNRQYLDDYFNSLAGIDYKGSHESALMQRAALAQLLRAQEARGPIDYTSAAPMADQFSHSRNQLSADLAARGINGPAVGGALSNSYTQEARGIGDYIRQLLQQRESENHGDMQRFLDWARGLQTMGLSKNIDEQNSGGFWDALAGVGGSLLGGIIP